MSLKKNCNKAIIDVCVDAGLCVCVCVVFPEDVHAPDIIGWRLLSVSNVILNALQLKKFDTVSIQADEISDASILSDDKNEPDSLLISFGKFSFFYGSRESVCCFREYTDLLNIRLLVQLPIN